VSDFLGGELDFVAETLTKNASWRVIIPQAALFTEITQSRRWRMEQNQLKFIFTHLHKLSAKPQSALISLLCGIYGGRRHESHPNISTALEAQLNKTYSHLLFNNIPLT
jgi:hypothetical protein